jgi:hypothetical protein
MTRNKDNVTINEKEKNVLKHTECKAGKHITLKTTGSKKRHPEKN